MSIAAVSERAALTVSITCARKEGPVLSSVHVQKTITAILKILFNVFLVVATSKVSTELLAEQMLRKMEMLLGNFVNQKVPFDY